jgi:D-alanine-D-alanine ligase
MLINQFGKVGVLFGGYSAEREVSNMSGNNILQALKSRGINAYPFDPSKHSLTELIQEKFDHVFIALHVRYGEDGTLQGVLEQLGVPYTGSGVMASAIGIDKVMTKRIWQGVGLLTPQFVVLNSFSTTPEELRRVPDALGLPLVLKAPHEGSTIGLSKVLSSSDMEEAFKLCAKYDERVLAEEFIAGRELTVPVLGTICDARALNIVEIQSSEGIYTYQQKYLTHDTKYMCPAPLDEKLTKRIKSIAVEAFHALGCKGWARVDFMLRSSDNEAFLLEINTSPGMTIHSLLPIAAKAEGISYEDLCIEILKSASLNLKLSKDQEVRAK